MVQSSGLPQEPEGLPVVLNNLPEPPREVWQNWRDAWWWQTQAIEPSGASELEASVSEGLRRWNLSQTPTRPLIESLWESIDQGDDWRPLKEWLSSVMTA